MYRYWAIVEPSNCDKCLQSERACYCYQERADAVTMATLRAPAAATATAAAYTGDQPQHKRHPSHAHTESRSMENLVDGYRHCLTTPSSRRVIRSSSRRSPSVEARFQEKRQAWSAPKCGRQTEKWQRDMYVSLSVVVFRGLILHSSSSRPAVHNQ